MPPLATVKYRIPTRLCKHRGDQNRVWGTNGSVLIALDGKKNHQLTKDTTLLSRGDVASKKDLQTPLCKQNLDENQSPLPTKAVVAPFAGSPLPQDTSSIVSLCFCDLSLNFKVKT